MPSDGLLMMLSKFLRVMSAIAQAMWPDAASTSSVR